MGGQRYMCFSLENFLMHFKWWNVPKTGFWDICQPVNDTKDKTDPNLQDMETEEYNFSTSYTFYTRNFSKECIGKITSTINSNQLVGVSDPETI